MPFLSTQGGDYDCNIKRATTQQIIITESSTGRLRWDLYKVYVAKHCEKTMTLAVIHHEVGQVREIRALIVAPERFITVNGFEEQENIAYMMKELGKSKHSIIDRFSFVRKGRDYLQSLDKLWDQNQYYVGEWHYHPYSSSSPSPTDINTMLRLSSSKKLHCPEPILIIIGGQRGAWDLSVSVFSKGEK